MTTAPGGPEPVRFEPAGGEPLRAAPPTMAGPLPTPARTSSWPTAVGVIAIVFGAGGLLANLWGALAPLFIGAIAEHMPAGQQASIDVAIHWQNWTVAFSLLQFVLAILLLLGGIGLLQRRPSGRRRLLWWAPLKMLAAVAGLFVGWAMQQESLQVMQQQGGPAALGAKMAQSFTVVGLVLALLWGCALPVFMLIWFTRPTIRAEVANWGPAPVER